MDNKENTPAIVDERTAHLDLPLPSPYNYLEDDIGRLRESFVGVDTAVAALDAALTALNADAALKQVAIQAVQKLAEDAKAAALAGIADAAGALVAHNNAPDAHPDMQTLPTQTDHAGEMLTTDGTTASWSAVPKTDWDSITGKPSVSVVSAPNSLVCRDADGNMQGNITGTARYA